MPLDTLKNFAKGTVSAGYNAAAVSIDLSAGHGARMPATPFNAVWWNATDYADPSDDPNVEIVRVTGVVTDTLAITRAQEGTAASTKNDGGKTYKIMACLTAASFDNLPRIIKQTATPPATNVTNVTGANLYTYAIPAGAMQVGDRIVITGEIKRNTGTTSGANPKFVFGATSTAATGLGAAELVLGFEVSILVTGANTQTIHVKYFRGTGAGNQLAATSATEVSSGAVNFSVQFTTTTTDTFDLSAFVVVRYPAV